MFSFIPISELEIFFSFLLFVLLCCEEKFLIKCEKKKEMLSEAEIDDFEKTGIHFFSFLRNIL